MPQSRAVRVRRSGKQSIEILTRGVSPSRFWRWRRRLRSVSAGDFVASVPAPSPAMARPGWSLDVALPNGVCLRPRG